MLKMMEEGVMPGPVADMGKGGDTSQRFRQSKSKLPIRSISQERQWRMTSKRIIIKGVKVKYE